MARAKQRRASRAARQLSPIEIIGTYEVEAIVAVRPIKNTKNKRFEYLVQWAGYPGEDTWEPREHLDEGCRRLVRSLWREIGALDPSRDIKIVRPSKEWIDAEVHYFRKKYTEPEHGTWHRQTAIGYNEDTGRMNVYD